MSRLLALYPRGWRERYGAELESVLEQGPPTFADRVDLVRGAFDAHLHPELAGLRGDVRAESAAAAVIESALPSADLQTARRLGAAALFGVVAWLVAWYFAATGPIVSDGYGTYRDGSAAFPFAILAAGLLVAGLCGQIIILPRSARLARAGAILAIPSVLLWSLGPWVLITALASILGLALLAVGVLAARAWPLAASLALLVAIIGAPLVVMTVPHQSVITTFEPALAAFAVGLVVPWLTVGGTLVRAARTAPEPAA